MKKISLFLVLSIALFLVVFPKDSNAQSDFVKSCVVAKITVGNNTYVPLNLGNALPSEKVLTILWIVKTFEDWNPELEVLNWKIEKQQDAHRDYVVFGIWIQHKPNLKYKKPTQIPF